VEHAANMDHVVIPVLTTMIVNMSHVHFVGRANVKNMSNVDNLVTVLMIATKQEIVPLA